MGKESGNFAACTFRNSFLFFISPYFKNDTFLLLFCFLQLVLKEFEGGGSVINLSCACFP